MLNIENIGKRLRQVRKFFEFTQQRMAEVVRKDKFRVWNDKL